MGLPFLALRTTALRRPSSSPSTGFIHIPVTASRFATTAVACRDCPADPAITNRASALPPEHVSSVAGNKEKTAAGNGGVVARDGLRKRETAAVDGGSAGMTASGVAVNRSSVAEGGGETCCCRRACRSVR